MTNSDFLRTFIAYNFSRPCCAGSQGDARNRSLSNYLMRRINSEPYKIDYILILKRFRNVVKTSKPLPGADCDSDHIPVMCKCQGNLRS
ncbi:craniofacial development protein 2-like [Plakobranchus ocellatus]|uniref:Craniofacial development protein 2-like n=1 Tax=Plakobranchus ocellatus TaxID=259542 RepID=A0AAV3YEK9_9GAST|nr:craniofacial development protein 2-like [Plakobranchus ocellatus]